MWVGFTCALHAPEGTEGIRTMRICRTYRCRNYSEPCLKRRAFSGAWITCQFVDGARSTPYNKGLKVTRCQTYFMLSACFKSPEHLHQPLILGRIEMFLSCSNKIKITNKGQFAQIWRHLELVKHALMPKCISNLNLIFILKRTSLCIHEKFLSLD